VTPCAGDIEKFCAKVPIGSGRIQECLKEHEKELSRSARLATRTSRRRWPSATCRYDISRFCWDVSPGHGRIAACLDRHRSDLSPACGDRLQKAGQPVAK
jgi:hypothetical protein